MLSGGDGQVDIIDYDVPNLGIHTFRTSGQTNGGNKDFTQKLPTLKNGQYTFSVWVRGLGTTEANVLIRIIGIRDNIVTNYISRPSLTYKDGWKKYVFQIDTSKFDQLSDNQFQFGMSGNGSVELWNPMLEEGTVDHNNFKPTW